MNSRPTPKALAAKAFGVRGCSIAAESKSRVLDSFLLSEFAQRHRLLSRSRIRAVPPLRTHRCVSSCGYDRVGAGPADILSRAWTRCNVGRLIHAKCKPKPYEKCQGGELNSRPRAYESPALPLSYPGVSVLNPNLPRSVFPTNPECFRGCSTTELPWRYRFKFQINALRLPDQPRMLSGLLYH